MNPRNLQHTTTTLFFAAIMLLPSIMALQHTRLAYFGRHASMLKIHSSATNNILSQLSSEQQKAVTAPVNGVSIVSAGPGSGKTRVLTHRIAHLIQNCGVRPSSIVALTFTNRAAKEMKDRLHVVLSSQPQKNSANRIWAGTYHSYCLHLLRQYSGYLPELFESGSVSDDFTVCDQNETIKLLRQLMKAGAAAGGIKVRKSSKSLILENNIEWRGQKLQLTQAEYDCPVRQVMEVMTSLRRILLLRTITNDCSASVADTPLFDCMENLLADLTQDSENKPVESARQIKTRYFDELSIARGAADRAALKILPFYINQLRRLNAVDFDDLILAGWRLLKMQRDVKLNLQSQVQHILVDEFQDTDPIQSDLLRLMYAPEARMDDSRSLFAVGDPNQSIYGWRGALKDIKSHLQEQYGTCSESGRIDSICQFELLDNYRSTYPICAAANAIIKTNATRSIPAVDKAIDLDKSVRVMQADSEDDETSLVISLITKKLHDLANTDGIERRGDAIAVLVRTKAQMKKIENALITAAVPYRLIGSTTRFFDREEIKDALAYLRILSNPRDLTALRRCLNRPARGIGKSTENSFVNWAVSSPHANECGSIDLHAVMREISYRCSAEEFDDCSLKPRELKKLNKFAELLISWLDLMESEELSLRVFLEMILDILLQSPANDEEEQDSTRRENLLLLHDMLEKFEGNSPVIGITTAAKEEIVQFLHHVALFATENSINMRDDSLDETVDALDRCYVSLSTIHSAKGLEFDTVIVPGAMEGLLPLHWRDTNCGEDPEEEKRQHYLEERRVAFVAASRARHQLFFTYNTNPIRPKWGLRMEQPTISPYLMDIYAFGGDESI